MTFDIHWVDCQGEGHTTYFTVSLWLPLGKYIAKNVVLPYDEHEGLQSCEGTSFCPESLGKVAGFLKTAIASSGFETLSPIQQSVLTEFHNICVKAVWVAIS